MNISSGNAIRCQAPEDGYEVQYLEGAAYGETTLRKKEEKRKWREKKGGYEHKPNQK